MKTYASNDIRSFSLVEETEASLTFAIRPMLETAWYFAGVTLDQAEDQVNLALVRCPVGSDCDVAVKARFTPGSNEPHQIEIENVGKPVVVRFSDGVERAVFEPG